MTSSNEISPTLDGDPNKGAYDQKPINLPTKKGDEVDDDDPHKAEKLTKAGRDIDPDDGSD